MHDFSKRKKNGPASGKHIATRNVMFSNFKYKDTISLNLIFLLTISL